MKVANFTKSTYSLRDRMRATRIPFANTGDEYTVMVRGREAVDQPAGTTDSYSRRNHAGRRSAKPGHYDDAASQGHKVVCALLEVTGACYSETADYLHQLAVEHGNKIPLEHKGASWTDTSFLSHVLQRTSIGVKKAAAKAIRRAIRNKLPPPKRCYSLDASQPRRGRGAA